MPRSTRRRRSLAIALALLACATPTAIAQQVVIYRCTDASGALTVQNDEPCPAGSREERAIIEPPPPMPVYVPQTPAPAPVASSTAQADATATPVAPERPDAPAPARIADADRLPPPPIFRCHTPGNDRYVSEDAEPKPRCVPLQTVGINGDPGLAAGAACEWQYDRCERIPDGEACDGWRQRGREIESTWRYARGDARAPLQEAFARVSTILSDTTCGLPPG